MSVSEHDVYVRVHITRSILIVVSLFSYSYFE